MAIDPTKEQEMRELRMALLGWCPKQGREALIAITGVLAHMDAKARREALSMAVRICEICVDDGLGPRSCVAKIRKRIEAP